MTNNIKEESSKRKAKRFVLLPVMKYLAKIILYDESNISKILTSQEKKEWDFFYNDSTRTAKIPFLFMQLGVLEERMKGAFIPYIDEILHEKSLSNPDVFKISYCFKRKNLPEYLKNYDLKKFAFLEIEINVSSKTNSRFIPTKPNHYDYIINCINRGLDFGFKFFVYSQLNSRGNKTIEQVLNDIYTLFDLKETELKKNALIRSYYRYKSKYPKN